MRRRQKNNLLPKMIGIAVIINAILLPILAQMGVFKGGKGQRLTQVTLVKLPPPEKKPAVPKKPPVRRRVAKARPAGHKSPARSAPSRPNPNQPKLVAAAPKANDTGDNGIDNSGTAPLGQTPTAPPSPAPPAPAPPPVTPPPPPVTPPAPAPTKEISPPVKSVPVLAQAEPLSQPRPMLPDDLSVNQSPNTFRALFTVHTDGTADVKMVSSTGSADLDRLALDAARRWTFRPAALDGRPVESYLRLVVEFDVSG